MVPTRNWVNLFIATYFICFLYWESRLVEVARAMRYARYTRRGGTFTHTRCRPKRRTKNLRVARYQIVIKEREKEEKRKTERWNEARGNDSGLRGSQKRTAYPRRCPGTYLVSSRYVMGRAGSRWQGCVTRRLRTVTKIFKNMYLSDWTAARPVPVPVPSANRLPSPPSSAVPCATCTYVPTYPRESDLTVLHAASLYLFRVSFLSCVCEPNHA